MYFKVGWYGTGEKAKAATEVLEASRVRIYTEKDVTAISQKVLDLKSELDQLKRELETLQEESEPIKNLLEKYTSVDDEVKEVT